MADVALVYLRRTLRLYDNPVLAVALAGARTVVPVFVDVPDDPLSGRSGAAARVWLARSLQALDSSLAERGARLTVLEGPPAETLLGLARLSGAEAVYADRLHDPASRAADGRLSRDLSAGGIAFRTLTCSLLREPDGPLTSDGRAFRVFSAYHRACLREDLAPEPLPAPPRVPVPDGWSRPGATGTHEARRRASSRPHAGLFADAPSLARVAEGMDGVWPLLLERWRPGEAGAQSLAERFLGNALEDYTVARDLPGIEGTSRLSPHLAFGEISPRQLLADAHEHAGSRWIVAGAEAFARQLYWREFAYYLLHHFPHTVDHPLRPEFEAFPWAHDPAALEAWQTGRTGYPLVDAGMRELAATGWMHNRVRMVVASFLAKDLLLPWQTGAAHFIEYLADADVANNTLGWQWVAGGGADAAPYFRVFNPVLQGERFDPSGRYVRMWIPELSGLPDRFLHRPWTAPADVLAKAGIVLGETCPERIVEHAEARERALAAFRAVRSHSRAPRDYRETTPGRTWRAGAP